MVKLRLPIKQRGVMLIGVTVALTVLVAGFIGFSYVNSKQKLASAEQQPTKTSAIPKISVSDIKPIVDTTSLDEAARQLSGLDTELAPDQCVRNLITDVESIAN